MSHPRQTKLRALVPPSPPCFADRLSWVEYVMSAARVKPDSWRETPFLMEAGQPVRINPQFNFCGDCVYSQAERGALAERGMCRPQWLIEGQKCG